jgi:glycosyltransferase involved in cell wall biosynthesis
MAGSGPTISVCICTCRRPAGLRRLLDSLARLDPATPSHEILVVDNDAGRAGESVVRLLRDGGLSVRYFSEPQRGLARARNRLVSEARGEFLAFIDDDEEADARWLIELWGEVTRRQANGGIGPVLPRFEDSAPRWMIEGRFFERDRFPTGTVLDWHQTRTGNSLIRRSTLTAVDGPFDLAFDHTGSEDTNMFRRVIEAGSRIIAVDTALVHEHLPPQRTTTRWLLRRWFYISFAMPSATAHGLVPSSHLWAVRNLGLALGYAIAGATVFPVSRIEGLRLLRTAARALGRLARYLGMTYRPYTSDSWS